MLAQVASNYTSFLNHCSRTKLFHTYNNPVPLQWLVYLHIFVFIILHFMSNNIITSLNCIHHIIFSQHIMWQRSLFSNTPKYNCCICEMSVEWHSWWSVSAVSVITMNFCQGIILPLVNDIVCEVKMEPSHDKWNNIQLPYYVSIF
jgi:hypothetical protein